jgi:CAAX protease family protein
MEPEPQPPNQQSDSTQQSAETPEPAEPDAFLPAGPLGSPEPYHGLHWIFVGDQDLRAGWSVLLFSFVFTLVLMAVGSVFFQAHLVPRTPPTNPTAEESIFSELIPFLALLAAAAVIALVERRRLLDFNLRGPRRPLHFFSGFIIGFLALSALIGALAWGHWLRLGPQSLSAGQLFRYALLWAFAFLLVGCVEEGTFRGYLQFTLSRGINFWWALGVNAAICLDLVLRATGNGVWGDYALAFLGVIPCYILHRKSAARSAAFWQAAWVTSTLFGFLHTGNGGENWIGIFAAGAIGFVFCVSIWATGSAWWAIGCHAGWDWGETYFYGTADSGLIARGHLFASTPAGNVLWSGGKDGPEGSLLVIAVILLLLLFLLTFYRRKNTPPAPAEKVPSQPDATASAPASSGQPTFPSPSQANQA